MDRAKSFVDANRSFREFEEGEYFGLAKGLSILGGSFAIPGPELRK